MMNQEVLPGLGVQYRGNAAPPLRARRGRGWSDIHLGIAGRLALWTAAIGTVAIGVITLYMYGGSADAITARERTAMVATLGNVDLGLNAQLASARGDALFLAGTPQVLGIGHAQANGGTDQGGKSQARWEADLAALFSAMLVARPQYAALRFVELQGGAAGQVRIDRDPDGRPRRVAPGTSDTPADQRAVAEAAKLSRGLVYTSDFGPAAAGGEHSIGTALEVAAPAFSETGALLGVLVAHVDASLLFNAIDDQFRGTSSVHIIADQDGRYLEHADPDGVAQALPAPGRRVQDDLPELASVFSGDSQPYSGVASLGDETYLAAARRINFDPERPSRFVGVVELRSQADLLARITALRNQAIVAATLLLLFGFVAVWWLARLVVRPLRQVTALAGRVAAGERAIRLDELMRRRDETGELARAFELMLREIETRETDLARQATELQRSNRELSHFAYVASHDLQEPLRMVASYLELLRRRYQGKLDADADEFIGFAVDGATRMKALINDVLGYARISNAALSLQTVDLGDVARGAAAVLAAKIDASGAELTIGELPKVEADPATMERLFINLIENAVKYRADAPPRISLSSRRSGSAWQISIADNGIGIAPEFREKVFEIFTRLHGREKYEGTGIGLAACRRIVERHGGRIWVTDAPGGGSLFTFTLPATRAEGVDDAEE